MGWIEDNNVTKPLSVVLGPAGSGKTSLLGSVARRCKEKKYHAASFFFSGIDSTRNTAECLFNTIAYQVAVAIPELQPYVARAINSDSTILSRGFDTRFASLLVEPFEKLQADHDGISFQPRVILIDALDECGKRDDRRQVISILSKMMSCRSLPFRCVLSSRFDRMTENEFSYDPVRPLVHCQIKLGHAGPTELNDIRTYLEYNIREIQSKHPFRESLPNNWPSNPHLVDSIVGKSGGQFIYASTIIKYIESQDDYPHQRLDAVLGISRSDSPPFADIDDIYRTLLGLVSKSNIDAVLQILGIEVVMSSSEFWTSNSWQDSSFFNEHFRSLSAEKVLAPLAPVLKCDGGNIKFYHLSFATFLLDQKRSGKFYIKPEKWQKWVVSQLVRLFYTEACTSICAVVVRNDGNLSQSTLNPKMLNT